MSQLKIPFLLLFLAATSVAHAALAPNHNTDRKLAEMVYAQQERERAPDVVTLHVNGVAMFSGQGDGCPQVDAYTVDATVEGLTLHGVVRDAIANDLARRDPERYRTDRRRAWRFLRAIPFFPAPMSSHSSDSKSPWSSRVATASSSADRRRQSRWAAGPLLARGADHG